MSGKTYLRNKNFFKRDYFEALKYILPGYLYEDDVSGTPKSSDLVDTIINSHIDIADNFSSILNVSTLESFESISPYFVKQNELTKISTNTFEDKILYYFNKKFKDFQNSDQFSQFIEDTVLSSITLNNPDTDRFSEIGSASAIHSYLITNLSWVYFLNTSGPSYNPSSYVRDLLVSSTYAGKDITLLDGINGLTEYVWRNASASYYPSSIFSSGTRSDLSGTQQLDKLKTWNNIIYSPLFSDKSDFRVRDKIETYADSKLKSSKKIEDGPFAKLIRALSFFAYDIDNDTEQISTLYDLEDCPDDYLPLIAQLIGWDLFGNDPKRWRLQLRNAVPIYKAIGTRKAVQSTVNTIFPKNTFPIQGRITELWESYVPYLIYYALATESSYFKDFNTWTTDLANKMNIEKYSTSDMDENIRLAVDRIILEVVRQFPDKFPIDSWIDTFNSVFNYRGRNYSIPPFEEYPYYVNIELDSDMVAFLSDRLACFGVRKEFALDVSSYITQNALTSDDEPRLGSWLIFTSGYNAPPNLDNLIKNLNDNRFDYASLWSGKSSHFKLVLQSSEFDFTRNNLDDTGTGDSVKFLSQAVTKTSPAHSIPIITLEITNSDSPDSFNYQSSCLPYVYMDREEISAGAGGNKYSKGIFLDTYKRGINTDGNVIGRAATQSLVSPELLNVSTITGVDRNTARRRSFEKAMPFNGYYDRTGFNMPVGFDMASSLSGIPLGLIPSSLSYTPVSSHIQLPSIWAHCEGLNSNNTYYEYDVSNTMNTRGNSFSFQANTDRKIDRGQLPGIYAAMHRISESKKYLKSFLDISASTSALESYLADLRLAFSFEQEDPGEAAVLNSEIARIEALLNGDYRSYTSRKTNEGASGYDFPTSVNDYYYFEFGRDLHRLYNIYKDKFIGHRLSPDIQNQDGANLFSHIFGPLLYNHNFEKLGNVTDLIASSFINPFKITFESDPFAGVGGYSTSALSSLVYNTTTSSFENRVTPERTSSGIVDGVELVLTSGTQADSSFSILRIPNDQRAFYEDPFLYDKTLILMRSGVNSATRLRFDISKYAAPSYYPISNNFLSPDHDYRITLSSLISNDSGTSVGGRSVGVWIHTKPEEGKMWTFTPAGEWIQHDQYISRSELLYTYCHRNQSEARTNDPKSTSSTITFKCLDSISNSTNSIVRGLGEDDFDSFELSFNTRNRFINLPKEYQRNHNNLHRYDQNYVVEVFMFPGAQPDEFMLVDKIEIQDMTLKKLSEIFATGTLNDPLRKLREVRRNCLEYRVELSKQDLFDVFKHFNNLSGKNAPLAYASRDKNKTETIMESEGGSRIDYRFNEALAVEVLKLTGNVVINSITYTA